MSMGIGELARRAGVAPSAVRYYERAGLLPAPPRTNGRRVYAADALSRLAVILHARAIGFSIAETRRLVGTFPPAAPSARWKALAAAKLAAMDVLIARAQAMKTMLQLISRCRCASWEECGERLLRVQRGATPTRAGGASSSVPRARLK